MSILLIFISFYCLFIHWLSDPIILAANRIYNLRSHISYQFLLRLFMPTQYSFHMTLLAKLPTFVLLFPFQSSKDEFISTVFLDHQRSQQVSLSERQEFVVLKKAPLIVFFLAEKMKFIIDQDNHQNTFL